MSSRTRTARSVGPSRILIEAAAANRIEREIVRSGDKETGGILLGWSRGDLHVVVVATATGPGRKAKRRRTSVVLDTVDLQAEIDRQFRETDGRISYLGDWHLHHTGNPSPSNRDLESLREIAALPEIELPNPLLLVLGKGANAGLVWRAWCGADATPVVVELEHPRSSDP